MKQSFFLLFSIILLVACGKDKGNLEPLYTTGKLLQAHTWVADSLVSIQPSGDTVHTPVLAPDRVVFTYTASQYTESDYINGHQLAPHVRNYQLGDPDRIYHWELDSTMDSHVYAEIKLLNETNLVTREFDDYGNNITYTVSYYFHAE